MVEAKIDHLLTGHDEVKFGIILASEKLEKKIDVLGKMMPRTQNVNSKKILVSQTALELAAKGHKVKHERRYSCGMMSIKEDDERKKFLFGQEIKDQAKLHELKKWSPSSNKCQIPSHINIYQHSESQKEKILDPQIHTTKVILILR